MEIKDIRDQVEKCRLGSSGRRIFPRSLKATIIDCALETNLSLVSFCSEINIHVGTVSTWLRLYRKRETNNGSFKKIEITDLSSRKIKDPLMTLTSPSGFSLRGSPEAIIGVWRQVDASATR